MSPTRRDILKLSAGVVTAALANIPVAHAELEQAEPFITWEMTAPVILDSSDGRRVVFGRNHTDESIIINYYPDLTVTDHETVWIEGQEAIALRSTFRALARGMAGGMSASLEREGVRLV